MVDIEEKYVPGLAGIPATRSSVSCLDGAKGLLAYRGKSIFNIVAQKIKYEDCAYELIYGTGAQDKTFYQKALVQAMHLKPEVEQVLRHIPVKTHPMEVLSLAVLTLSAATTNKLSLNPKETPEDKLNEYCQQQICCYLGGVATIVAGWQRIRQGLDPLEPKPNYSFAENFWYMFSGQEPSNEIQEIIDVCLILHAEHTINASTFATMVTGSTLANPGCVISTGVNTLSGPLHGGANEKVVHMIEQIGSVENTQAWLDETLAHKRVIWGMGHREYKTKDPRAVILQSMIQRFYSDKNKAMSSEFKIALDLEKLCEEKLAHKGVYPNVDYYSGILYREIGIPTDQFTPIFAVSRTAGWLAHWLEQIRDNRIFRPTQIYTGKPIAD